MYSPSKRALAWRSVESSRVGPGLPSSWVCARTSSSRMRPGRHEQDQPFEKPSQFGRIAAPRQRRQQRQGRPGQRLERTAAGLAQLLEEVRRQRRNVFAALTQGGNVDADEREPLVQIRPQPPFFERRLDRSVGGGNDTNRQGDALARLFVEHFAVAQHADETRLRPRRHLRDVLEEEKPAERFVQRAVSADALETAAFRRVAAALHQGTKQEELDVFRNRVRAIDLEERTAALRAVRMNGAGDHLAAAAAFAADQDPALRRRGALHEFHHRPHCRRRADNAVT